MEYETRAVRNIAIAGHGQTGKTTLLEQLLYCSGSITAPALVESGKTVSDFTAEEIKRHISIYASLAAVEYNKTLLNFWDTPGSPDFSGEVISAFRASETALMVIDARTGVQIETVKQWRDLDRRNKPRIIFVNHADDPRAAVADCVHAVHASFSVEVCPVTIPMISSAGYAGVIDVLHGVAYPVPEKGQIECAHEIPGEYAEIYRSAYGVLAGSAAEGDDDLLVKFIDEGELTTDEIVFGLKNALAENKVVPQFTGAPLCSSGLIPLLDFISAIAPCPLQSLETVVTPAQDTAAIKFDPEKPFSSLIVKTAGDQFSGKLSYLKLVTGILHADSEVTNVSQNKKEKIGKIYRCAGRKLIEVKSVAAGDVCVVSKLSGTGTSDTLAADSTQHPFVRLRHPEPVYALAVSAKNRKDDDKLAMLLLKAAEENRTVTFQYNAETKENVLSGMGELQLSIILDRIREETGIEGVTAVPHVAYRETVGRKATAEYTHKKQSGGHGQYAKVVLAVQPLSRGENYKFTNAVFGGAIPRNYIPGVEKGVKEALEHGVLAGYPVVDVAVTILDGKDHPVDSSDLAFQIAARNALHESLSSAGPILLEPVMNISVWIESRYTGDIMSDLSARRGRILGQNSLNGGIEEIRAQVPESELLRYAVDLRSMTSATGSFETAFDHYDAISGKLAESVIMAAKASAVTES
jgi:elongation factor G